MVALHDANKYRGTLVVHKIDREDVEAMMQAAESKVTPEMVQQMVSAYVQKLPPDELTVITPEILDQLEERALKALVKGFTKMLMFGELRNRGFDTTARVGMWDTIDEHGEWVSTTFCQGDDAIPMQ